MRRFRTLLLLILLTVGLPLKGVAATSGLFCGPLHHHSGGNTVQGAHDHAMPSVDTSHPHGHGDAHDQAGHHGHDSGAAGHLQNADGATASGAAEAQPPFADSTKCSACATCGAHAVADSPVAAAPGFVAALRDTTPFESSLHDGIFIGGLERPPKSFLA